MNNGSIRKILTVTAILVTFGGLTIANRGETAEQTLDEVCASAVWPRIPATCFSRPEVREVYLPAGQSAEFDELSSVVDRNSQPNIIRTSGKADLPQSIEIGGAQYRVIETRGDGVSVLKRVEGP
jgi:hypothetical protein